MTEISGGPACARKKGLSLIKLIYGHEKEVEEEIDARIVLLYGAPTRVAIDAANAAILAANQNNALAAQGAQGAPAAVAVPAAAVGQPGVLPNDYVHQIYIWLVQVRTQHRPSGLLTANQNTQFENWKLSDVGINRDNTRQHWLRTCSLLRQISE